MGRISILASLFSMTDEQAMWRVQRWDDHRAFAQLMAVGSPSIPARSAPLAAGLPRGSSFAAAMIGFQFADDEPEGQRAGGDERGCQHERRSIRAGAVD